MELIDHLFKGMDSRRHRYVLMVCALTVCACKSDRKLYHFVQDGQYGMKNARGKVVVEPSFDRVWLDRDGMSTVIKDGKWGKVDSRGDLVIKLEYDYVGESSEEALIPARSKNLQGFLDLKGDTAIPFLFNIAWGFEYGMARVQKGRKWGYIDPQGNEVIPIVYDQINAWSDGVMAAKKDGKWGFIDRHGDTVIPFEYDDADQLSEGLALVGLAGKWGYIDRDNNVRIPFMYDSPIFCDGRARGFTDGIAQVNVNGQYGYIDRENAVVIELKYERLGRFRYERAWAEVGNGGSWAKGTHRTLSHGYIDRQGNEHLMPYFDFRSYTPSITHAPDDLPDFSSRLNYSYEREVDVPGVGELMMVIRARRDEEDGLDRLDTTVYYTDIEGDSVVYLPIENYGTKETIHVEWTLETILEQGVMAFVQEPFTYSASHDIQEVCTSYGLMIGGGNYGHKLFDPRPEGWKAFQEGTLHAIIRSESLRELAWSWVMPHYVEGFQLLHPFHKQTYRDLAEHVRNYINNYDIKRVQSYLKRDEPRFAYYDADGSRNPYRKACAFVDRLIVVHKVITVEDAKRWINRIADEVKSW